MNSRIAHAKRLVEEVRSWSDRKLYVTYSQVEYTMRLKTKSTQNFCRTSGQRGSGSKRGMS